MRKLLGTNEAVMPFDDETYPYKMRRFVRTERDFFKLKLRSIEPTNQSSLLGRYESVPGTNGLALELSGAMTPITDECANRSREQTLEIAHTVGEKVLQETRTQIRFTEIMSQFE